MLCQYQFGSRILWLADELSGVTPGKPWRIPEQAQFTPFDDGIRGTMCLADNRAFPRVHMLSMN
jgi:hypothetical protein